MQEGENAMMMIMYEVLMLLARKSAVCCHIHMSS
jgi:hypothetical protein